MQVFGVSIGTLTALGAAYLFWTFRASESGTESGTESGDGTGDPTPPGDPASTLNGPPSVERHINAATRAANLTGVSRDLILAVIWQESAGDKTAVGSAGEQGLMQVTRVAAEDVGESLPSTKASAQRQITVGAKYLSKCIQHYAGGDRFKGLRTYNEGPPPHTAQASKEYAQEVTAKLSTLRS